MIEESTFEALECQSVIAECEFDTVLISLFHMFCCHFTAVNDITVAVFIFRIDSPNTACVKKKYTILYSNSKTIESIQFQEIPMFGMGISSATWWALFHPNQTFQGVTTACF